MLSLFSFERFSWWEYRALFIQRVELNQWDSEIMCNRVVKTELSLWYLFIAGVCNWTATITFSIYFVEKSDYTNTWYLWSHHEIDDLTTINLRLREVLYVVRIVMFMLQISISTCVHVYIYKFSEILEYKPPIFEA